MDQTVITHPKDEILSRIPNNSYRADLCGLVETVYAIGNGVDEGLEKIKGDRNLSEEGKRAAVKRFMEGETQKLAEPSRRYASMLAQIVGQRKELGKPEFKTDPVSIADRQEVRAILRAEPDAMKRKRMALDFADTRECAEAILSGFSLAITKLDAQSMQEVREKYLDKFFGDERDRITAYHDNVKPLGAALGLARHAMQQAAEMPAHEFMALLPEATMNITNLENALGIGPSKPVEVKPQDQAA